MIYIPPPSLTHLFDYDGTVVKSGPANLMALRDTIRIAFSPYSSVQLNPADIDKLLADTAGTTEAHLIDTLASLLGIDQSDYPIDYLRTEFITTRARLLSQAIASMAPDATDEIHPDALKYMSWLAKLPHQTLRWCTGNPEIIMHMRQSQIDILLPPVLTHTDRGSYGDYEPTRQSLIDHGRRHSPTRQYPHPHPGVDPDIIYYGDTVSDVKAGIAAHVPTVFVDRRDRYSKLSLPPTVLRVTTLRDRRIPVFTGLRISPEKVEGFMRGIER